MSTNSIKLLTGNSHGQLAKLVADRYGFRDESSTNKDSYALTNDSIRLGIELAKIMVLQYSNNESSISIGESVRDEDGNGNRIYALPHRTISDHKIFQSSSSNPPNPGTSTITSWNS